MIGNARSALCAAVLLILTFGGAGTAAVAADDGALSVSLQSPDGRPVTAAAVNVDGAVHASGVTDKEGSLTFGHLAPGSYVLRAQKPGFEVLERSDVLIAVGATATLEGTMAPSSFSSLQVIGRVTSNAPGRVQINTTTAALQTISGQAFVDQGSPQVTKVLQEAPGLSLTSVASGGGSNHASLGAPEYPQLRGSLHYETASLIDGHAVSVGAIGTFSPLLVLPALLQNVEIAKGPGSMPTEINYAIGGTVNFRTLEPTRERLLSFDTGVDRYGGLSASLRATGSTSGGRIQYALAVATLGAPGPLQNYQIAGSQLALAFGSPPWTVNGQQFAGLPVFIAPATTPQYQGPIGAARYAEPLYLCCSGVSTGYNANGELGKIRVNLSEQTSLTLSYLGGQSGQDFTGTILGSLQPVINFSTFVPPAGYTGSVPAGISIPFDTQANTNYWEFFRQNLFQAEARTSLAGTTLLARAYSGYGSTLAEAYTPGQTVSITENAWGGVSLCPAGTLAKGAGCVNSAGAAVSPVTTFFNGQPTTLTTFSPANYTLLLDHVRGYSLEANRPIGSSLLTLAIDRSNHDSYEYSLSPGQALDTVLLPPGSGQEFTTLMARFYGPLAPRLSAEFGTYYTSYASHYTGDGGVTWSDSTHTAVIPRLGFSWRPVSDVAWRFALGGSIAPPYIALLSSPGTTPTHNPAGAAQGYFINANSGQIAPEQAFGYDLGVDWRLKPAMRLSADVYYTHLRDLFLTQTSLQGTYTPTSGASAGITEPLYVTQTGNLGNARYEGIEMELERAPQRGWGFKAQGSLQRAFTYNLPASFYATTAGPNTTNLGVVPEINFQASGNGYNAVSAGRIPYSQGYGEVTYRGNPGSLYLLGYTYFGSNNAFNQPAFGVLSGSIRIPLAADMSVQLSGDNLTGAYAQPYAAQGGGVPVPLVNGKLGVVEGSNYGPTTLRLQLRKALR